MTLNRKRALTLIIPIAFSIYLTIYTVNAYSVAHYVYDHGLGVDWRSTPPGTFLPWPRPPGIFAALSKMSFIDMVLYYLIKYHVLAGTCALFWIVTALSTYKLVKRSYQKKVINACMHRDALAQF